MKPVKTKRANFTFVGDGKTVGDVWVERRADDGTTRLTYEPSDADREVLAAGGRVELALWIGKARMPPVSLIVLTEAETHPVGEHYEHPMGADRGGTHVSSPSVILSVPEGVALMAAVQGDHFETGAVDSAIAKIQAAKEDVLP